ncbi:MAG: recombinase family protein [Pseudomonadota bacterium]
MSNAVRQRCAIYTRKSTQDGLDQAFNSLDAQREACSAFIASQGGLGWKELRERYDDGGVSGGTMNRPALEQLLTQIRDGHIDVVVVYKIDRLTRSLADFARMVELFERHQVAFVSVTQQFNTTSSMGRLTLNVLLSFAQFEREVTAERIRDKIAASRRRGLWMGGTVPFGYQIIDKALVPNEPQACIVVDIFKRYITLKSVRALASDLKARPPYGFERAVHNGWLYHLLSNPVYIGLVRHKDETFDGAHDPIVDLDLYNEAQRVRAEQRHAHASWKLSQGRHLLTGLVFDETGDRLTPTHSSKARKRSGYYISARLGRLRKRDADPGGWRLPARELERAVEQEFLRILQTQYILLSGLPNRGIASDSIDVLKAAERLARSYGDAAVEERKRLLAITFHRITIEPGKLTFTVRSAALVAYLLGMTPPTIDPAEHELHQTVQPFQLRRRGVEAKVVLTGDHPQIRSPEPRLVALLVRAHTYLHDLTGHGGATIADVAKARKVPASEVSRILPLAFLDPAITAAILDGTQPPTLTVDDLTRLAELPLVWTDQRKALGM